jgi:hypothetical protein
MFSTPEPVKANLLEGFEPREQQSWDLDSQSTSADSHDGSAHHIKCDFLSKDLGSASSAVLSDLGQSSTYGSTQSSPQSLFAHPDAGTMARQGGRKRRQSKNPKGHRSPCSFFLKGSCRFGEKCRDAHVAPPSGPQESTHGTFPKLQPNACRVCGKVTDPPHWGNECPDKDKLKDKASADADARGAPLVVQVQDASGCLPHGNMQDIDLEGPKTKLEPK